MMAVPIPFFIVPGKQSPRHLMHHVEAQHYRSHRVLGRLDHISPAGSFGGVSVKPRWRILPFSFSRKNAGAYSSRIRS